MAGDIIFNRVYGSLASAIPRINPANWQARGLVFAMPRELPRDGAQYRQTVYDATRPTLNTDQEGVSHQYGVGTAATTKNVSFTGFPFLTEFTITCRVSIPNTGDLNYHHMVSRGAVFVNNTNYAFGHRKSPADATTTRMFMFAYDGATIKGTEGGFVPFNTWYTMTLTWKSGAQTTYQDGSVLITSTSTNGADGSQSLVVGGASSYVSTSVASAAKLRDVRVYDYAFTASQAARHHREYRDLWCRRKRVHVSAVTAPTTGVTALPLAGRSGRLAGPGGLAA